jgi:ferredoxin
MERRVTIDRDLCIGSGDCGRLVPAAFRLDEDDSISIVLPGAQDADPALLLRAAHDCPTQAIAVIPADLEVRP